MSMEWEKLLSAKRLCDDRAEGTASSDRTEFQRDFDRIIFCSAFRRLQDKTQVFPLPQSDYVRTRLTHSLEVASVGRTLGTAVGERVIEKHELKDLVTPGDFGAIVAAACLAHDIGNPPFGHSGEEAMRTFFEESDKEHNIIQSLDEKRRSDLLRYEGNAQGFRILARLQMAHRKGGMQLTCATLAAFTKYPRCSHLGEREGEGLWWNKHGFFQDDANLFSKVAKEVELIQLDEKELVWCRHPLAFLVEAADDICYRVIDLEDGFRLGHLSEDEVKDPLQAVLVGEEIEYERDCFSDAQEPGKAYIEYLSAKVINRLVQLVVKAFMDHEEQILEGEFKDRLLTKIERADQVEELRTIASRKIYGLKEVIDVEAAGFEVLGGLLKSFVGAVEQYHAKDKRGWNRSKKFLELIPPEFLGSDRNPDDAPYLRTLKIADFVAGMTDTYAVSLYRTIKGISLPGMP